MTNVSPHETSSVLPKLDDIQSGDFNTLVKPILQQFQFQAKTRAALEDHMKLVSSQYLTGLARTSRKGGLGAAIRMEDLSWARHPTGARPSASGPSPSSRGRPCGAGRCATRMGTQIAHAHLHGIERSVERLTLYSLLGEASTRC